MINPHGSLEHFDHLHINGLNVFNTVGWLVHEVVWDDVGIRVQLLILWVVYHPVLQVIHCFDLIEDVGARHSQAQKRVQVFRITLQSIYEAWNRFLILIVLLKKLAEQSPSLSIRLVFPKMSLHSQNCVIVSTFRDEVHGEWQR